MQQAEATRAEPVFVASARKFRSFLLSIWATLQTTPNDMKLEINTLECVHFYFLYLSSAHLHEMGTVAWLCSIWSILFFLGIDLSSF